MTVAAEILVGFRDRLVQAHFSELNSKAKHFSMSYGAKRAYEAFATVLSQVPIILESVIDEAGIAAEIAETEKIFRYGSSDEASSTVRDRN
jgi:hypothetical protein